jgi:hypothetical protein
MTQYNLFDFPEPKISIKKKTVNEPFVRYEPNPSFVFWNSKLTHSGITNWKVFENCHRVTKTESLRNLLNNNSKDNEAFDFLLSEFKSCKDRESQKTVFDEALSYLNDSEFKRFIKESRFERNLSPVQSRAIRSQCSKLAYYSQTRHFKAKEGKKYNMRVAFLTLTSPISLAPERMNAAFNHFLDYLSRTANCVYVWKKELGEKNENLHFHIMINNFIPYYIVAWKWKRLLLNEGCKWPKNEKGEDTSSHYRIELPRNKKASASYISKYMSKGHELPGFLGYVWGCSHILKSLKEVVYISDDLPTDEIALLRKKSKLIDREYVTMICADLLHVEQLAPQIAALFKEQYIRFSETITLPQKFNFV